MKEKWDRIRCPGCGDWAKGRIPLHESGDAMCPGANHELTGEEEWQGGPDTTGTYAGIERAAYGPYGVPWKKKDDET